MVLVMVFSTLSLWLGMEDTLNSRLRSDIDVRSASTDVSALEAAVDETLRQAGASREDTWTYRYLSFSALPTPETMGVIRRDDAIQVLHLEKKDMSLMFFNLLWPDEIEAAWDRVEALQRAILKGEKVRWKDEWETRRNIVRVKEDEEIAQMPKILYGYLPTLKRLVKIPQDLEVHKTRRLAG